MNIIVSQKSQTPIYEQIYGQIVAQITSGDLPADFCLPSIRNIAKEIGVSVITVKKAWELLEQNGFIYTMVGKGCFINGKKETREVENIICERLKNEVNYYKNFGITLQELISLIKKVY